MRVSNDDIDAGVSVTYKIKEWQALSDKRSAASVLRDVEAASQRNKSTVIPPSAQPMPSTRHVPRLGAIACGEPILAEQNIENYDEVPDYIKCDFTLLCRGDSMINARVYDGDVVCIKQQERVENGQIAAVLVNDEATLKRVRYLQNGIALWPENPEYDPLVFTGDEVERVRILGLATHFISKIV
ncbi:MAG: hypothetical protein IKN81_06635 [Oscillospiraceae bacterium]|nr:hypothetical protein [Oscillospiraceae bacterium]